MLLDPTYWTFGLFDCLNLESRNLIGFEEIEEINPCGPCKAVEM